MVSGTPAAEPPRSAATKVLDVLAALSEGRGPHRITDIAAATGLAKATVYRMLQDLVRSGFVVAAPDSRYDIGPRFLGLANAALTDAGWHGVVRAGLEQLRTSTGLGDHFAQAYRDRVVIVDTVAATDPFAIPARAGRSTSLDQSAFGRAIAAAQGGVPVIHDDEQNTGVRSIAAAILSPGQLAPGQQVLGAIGVSGTRFTLSEPEAVERIGAVVVAAAEEVSAVLASRSEVRPIAPHRHSGRNGVA